MNKLNQMITAMAHGLKRPYITMKIADETGVPFYALCAVLEKESSGGMNVFGHDPTIFIGAGRVTKKKYLAYKAERDKYPKKRMQGVGPMQLTWYTYQDEADARGGCWNPKINIQVGAEIIKGYMDQYRNASGGVSWVMVGKRYNGGLDYGEDLAVKIEKWKSLLS